MRDRGGARHLLAIGLIALAGSACRASAKASAKVESSGAQVDDDRKWEIPEPVSPPPEAPPAEAPKPAPRVAAAVAAPATPTAGVHFLGVVHDLSMSSGAPRTAVCRCLAVVYGAPSDDKFAWQGGTPLDADAVAIAISSDGVACPSGQPPARISISGIEREGTNIVLVLENVGPGRPIMRGALAASPGPNGAILVRTRNDAPYPSADGAGPCRIALK